MRDKRKEKEYFERFLDYQSERIDKKKKKLDTCDGEIAERVRKSLLKYQMDLIKASFSNGESKKGMQIILDDIKTTICETKSVSYGVLLDFLSLSLMFGMDELVGCVYSAHKDQIDGDKLLACFVECANPGNIKWEGEFIIEGLFDELNNLFINDGDKESFLIKYLNGWYDNRKDEWWYDSENSDNDTYCGYWSFESGALAKMLGLNEDILKENEYYPAI